ncbi:MAG: hypothetical protein LBR21_01455 [Propionibacteriaceae bacterium]|nr:hypothetical protein [Propionibacteriaceae bacterium]
MREIVSAVLAQHRDALTVIGGQAVLLQTHDRFGLNLETQDSDFAVNPALIADRPRLEDLLVEAGFVPRNPSRPGLWGRMPVEVLVPGGGTRIDYLEKVDLDVAFAFTENTNPKRRSVAKMKGHGKTATSSATGLELATLDRDLLPVPGIGPEQPIVEAWVASKTALLVAKSYKVGERLQIGRAFDDKDLADIFLLLDSEEPSRAAEVLKRFAADPMIGSSVEQGRAYIQKVLADPTARSAMQRVTRGYVPQRELEAVLSRWV